MHGVKSALLLASLALALSHGGASALSTTSENVACSSSTKLQSKIDAAPAGAVATFNISGTCNENITVPAGKTIILKGATATAKLNAASGALPALRSQGVATIQSMAVTNATGTAETLVQTDNGGGIKIISSDLSAPKVGTVVAAWVGSVEIMNSRITGGAYDAVEVWGGASSLEVRGDSSMPAGPTGKSETYIKTSDTGLLCSQGGVLNMRASGTGNVKIESARTGLSTMRCDFTIWNQTSSKANFVIAGKDTGYQSTQSRGSFRQVSIANSASQGMRIESSDIDISLSEITGNVIGLDAKQSRLAISGTLFDNKRSDVSGAAMSSINFNPVWGKSSFPKALGWTNSFSCNSGSRIDIDSGALVQSLGSKYNFLGCVYQN